MNLQENILRIREMMGLLKEEHNEYYDKILDLYSKVGMEGLSKDEIDFLKSGGQTELPRRFKLELSQEKHDEFVRGNTNTELKTSDWQDIFELQKIIDESPTQVFVVSNFDSVGFYLNSLCSLIFPMDEEIIKKLEQLNYSSSELSEVRNNKYFYVVPKIYTEHLTGIKYKKFLPPSDSDRPQLEF